MPDTSATARNRYAVAVAIIVAATLVRTLLDPVLGIRFPFATLFFAVLVAAWYGGLGPALLACALGSLASAWLLLPPQGVLAVAAPEDRLGLLVYGAVSVGIALIGGAMHRARRRAETTAAEAAAQREELRVTVASIGDAVITTDTQSRVTSMNAVAAGLTGWTVADAIGRPVDDIVRIKNEETGAPAPNPVARALAEGRIVGLANHTILVARDGVARPIDDSAAPIRDRAGMVVGVVLVFRDVTESRRAAERLRRSEEELIDLFENANVGLHVVDADGIVVRVNQAELDMLGYDRAEYVGHPLAEFHVDEHVVADILRRLAAGETLQGQPARLRCKDGSIRDVMLNASARWEDGRLAHIRCFTLDVTTHRRAEEAQALLAAVVESSEDAIVTKTLDGEITSWNAGAERLFGYTAAEAVGRSITLIIPPERHGEERTIQARLRAGERVEHFETVRVAKDGRRLDISLMVSPVRDAGGRIIGVSKVGRDITGRRRAEAAIRESEDRFRSLALNAPAAIFIKDLEGRYTLANPIACEALGRPEGVVGLTDHDLLPAAVADDLRRRDLEVIAGGRAIEGEEVLARPGYDRRFLSVKFPLSGADGSVGVCGVAIDITDRKRAEEELLAADRRKDRFLATLAHELRNPLAPLRNSLEILKRASDDAAAVARARATMERQTSHLERLIDDLVDIARINRDQIDLRREEVELASIVHHAVETCRPGADARRLEVDVVMAPEPIHLEGDPVRLAQVFSNLVSNACRYTDPGGRVWITTRREGPDAVVSVRDTGVGIPPEMLSSIFDIFIQLGQSPAQPQKGLGIGLTLVRRLVELHGGTVVARSEGPGRGSEFVVRLPALDAPAKLVAPALDGRHTALVARRILIVDDNTDAAESMATLLQIAGHETHVAHDGDRVRADARTLRPDVVLLDIGLPKLSGHDVARRIRAEGWGRDMVLVALTGWGQDEDVRSSLAVGFDHHLVKPVDVSLLMRLVEAPPISSGR